MKGWIVQIRTEDPDREWVTRWAVAHSDWTKAQRIAAEAQGVDAAKKPANVRVLTIRVRREASAIELQGLAEGGARQIE